jgi:hypothetical protein
MNPVSPTAEETWIVWENVKVNLWENTWAAVGVNASDDVWFDVRVNVYARVCEKDLISPIYNFLYEYKGTHDEDNKHAE